MDARVLVATLLLCALTACGGDDPRIEATASFFGVGEAPLGGSVAEVEAALNVDLGEVEPMNDTGDCGVAWTSDQSLGAVVATPGGVQAFVVATGDIPFVQATETPIRVGISTVEDVRAAFPAWVAGDDVPSLAGGERLSVTPREIVARALLVEADPSGIVRQFRVGVDDYALHTEYCTSPEDPDDLDDLDDLDDPTPADTGLRQDGLPGLPIERAISDLSTSDLIEAMPPDDFVLRPESEHCGVADRPDGSLRAITDAGQAIHAFVVWEAGWPTPEGIDVGSSRQDVLEEYGDHVRTELSDDDLVIIDDLETPGAALGELSLLYAFGLDQSGRVTAMAGGRFPWLLGCDLTEEYFRS